DRKGSVSNLPSLSVKGRQAQQEQKHEVKNERAFREYEAQSAKGRKGRQPGDHVGMVQQRKQETQNKVILKLDRQGPEQGTETFVSKERIQISKMKNYLGKRKMELI